MTSRLLILLLLTATAGGCTASNWSFASRHERVWLDVDGVVRDGDGKPAELVARYGGAWGGFRYLAIPLDITGQAPAPFALTTDRPMTMRQLGASLTREQVIPVKTYPFSEADQKRASALRHAPEYQAVDHSADSDSFGYSEWCTVVMVELNPDSTPRQGMRKDDDRLPAGTRLLLIPADLPRSGGDRAGTIAIAAALTPVTLVIDAVTLPIGFVVRLFTGC